MATTVPTAVCAIAPNSSEAATVVTASDPRTPPINDMTQTTTRRAMPPCAMISPARMKKTKMVSIDVSSMTGACGPAAPIGGEQTHGDQESHDREPDWDQSLRND